MENQLYIRTRGRVLGPYDQEKLQSLARRGQLSRLHELSLDATNWVRASTYPELFVSEELPPAAGRPGAADTPDAVRGGAQHPRASSQRWWYGKNGTEAGPVDQTALQQMLAAGSLSPDDIVWTEGMPQWVTARQVPGLVPTQTAVSGPISIAGETKGELAVGLCKTATNSRPWVLFIAIISFVYAGLAILVGILALIHGANHHLSPVVAWGLFELIFGVDIAAGGFLLSTYASRVASLRHSNHAVILEKSLDTLNTFWVYVSINLIVFLAFLVFAAIWVVAIGGTLPSWF